MYSSESNFSLDELLWISRCEDVTEGNICEHTFYIDVPNCYVASQTAPVAIRIKVVNVKITKVNNNVKVLVATFNQFNASMLNKSNNNNFE